MFSQLPPRQMPGIASHSSMSIHLPVCTFFRKPWTQHLGVLSHVYVSWLELQTKVCKEHNRPEALGICANQTVHRL